MEDKNKEKRKLVEFTVTDDEGNITGDMSLVSIVMEPAIERSFQLFTKGGSNYSFATINKEQQLIIGPAMSPNKRIVRYDEATDTYYDGFFSEDTIVKCSELLFKNSNHNKTNLEHGELLTSNQINGAYICQAWIVKDENMDTAISYGFKPRKGELFIAMKIESPSLWNVIKENGFSGFSIEGIFSQHFAKVLSMKDEKAVEQEIKSIVYDDNMSEIDKEIKIKNILF